MRALVILHDHACESGRVGTRLAERGYELSTITVVPARDHARPNVSYAFPPAEDWDLILALGAPWSVYDTDAIGTWVGAELALIRKAHDLGVPMLGVCFGAQLLAAALGGSVVPAARPEIGWTEVVTDVPSLVPPGPWLQWHYDRCVLPPDAIELARNELCPQAFQAGRGMGVQFHPEITPWELDRWLDLGGARECRQAGIDPQDLRARTLAEEPMALDRARRLVDAFLDQVARR